MTRSPHQYQFARPVSLRGSSIGRPAFPSSPGRAATFNHEQMLPGSERGARSFVSCRATPARDRQGFGHPSVVWFGRGFSLTALFHIATQTTNLAERFGARSSFRAIRGFGVGCNRYPFAINHHRRQRAFQCIRQRHPGHFKDLRFRDPKPTAARRPKSWFSLPMTRNAT